MRRIVVVGAGAAGIPAALTAARSGAEVTLVEKLDRPGGVLWWSGGLMSAAGTRLQAQAGISDSPSAHIADVQRIGRGRADIGVLSALAENAAASVDWLQDLGVPFAPEPIFAGHELYSVARSYAVEAPEEDGPLRGKVLAERMVAELGGEVASNGRFRLLTEHRVTDLVCDVGGRVVGVTAEGPASRTQLDADAVILAAGGYAANQELLRRFHSRFDKLITQSSEHATGDGVLLGEQAGAVVVNSDICLPGPGSLEDPDRPGFRILGGGLPIRRPPGQAGDIWVNRHGERFMAEDDPNPAHRERAIVDQPDAVMFVVFDEAMRVGGPEDVRSWTMWRLGDPPDLRFVVSRDSTEELAAAIGVPADALAATVRTYNAAVAFGDDAWGRTQMPAPIECPPFHAVPTRATVITTAAGLRVDDRFRALNRLGSVIPGLYVAGELIGSGQIQGDGNSSGMMITSAVSSGRLAAEHALAHEGRCDTHEHVSQTHEQR